MNPKIEQRLVKIGALQAEIKEIKAASEVQSDPHILDCVRTCMKAEGLTQRALAERMAVSQSHVSSILCGEHSPTLRTLSRVVEAIGYELQLSVRKIPAAKAA